MKKSLSGGILIAAAMIAVVILIALTSRNRTEDEYAVAEQGVFEISVTSAGELIAENSVDIKGPNIVRNRNFRAAPLKITDLVPEGTVVKKGDYIATLDRSGFSNTLKDEQEIQRTNQSELEKKVLDTAVALSDLRDDIRNQYYTASEAKVKFDESKFEPPAAQRAAEITLDKEQRTFEQKKKIYALKKAQIRGEIDAIKLKVAAQQRKIDDLDSILAAFTVTAPADGMVIYKRDPMGKKITAGTTLNPWDPIVATLPDMSSMLSKVYISEIEINKIEKGQQADIVVDAFRDRNYTGKVWSIANIGEQLQNSDTKVFEVLIKLEEPDPMLRPSMTTSNKVQVKTFDNVIYVPNESVHAGTDSIPFVYTRNKTRQVVLPGESNGKNIIIEKGLEPGTKIWLTVPADPGSYSLAGAELIPVIKERELARLEMNRSHSAQPGQGLRETEK